MSRRSNPTLIGVFVLGAMALLVLCIFLLTGSDLFAKRQRYVLYFEGSVYGLQVGAPMVFKGVQIGRVESIDLRLDPSKLELVIPVVVEASPQRLLDLGGQEADGGRLRPAMMIKKGLRARLSTQSMLTGLLYVELDFFPDKPAILRGSGVTGLPEIPTIPSPAQEIAKRLEKADLEGMVSDISDGVRSISGMLNSPHLAQALADSEKTAANLRAITDTLNARIGPLTARLDATLHSAERNLDTVGKSAEKFGQLADSANAPLESLHKAADELTRTAATLNQLAGEGGPALTDAGKTLKELREAANALQALSETLDRQPDALIFGRKSAARKEPTP